MRTIRCPACNMADLLDDDVEGRHCPNCFYKPGPKRVGEPLIPAVKGRRKRPGGGAKSRKKAA